MSTLHQVFSRLDREAFEALPEQWLGERGLEAGEALAIDGKRLRGIHGEQLPGVRLVAAYAHQAGIALGQQAVAHKRNEPEAVYRLLARLDLKDRGVTGDAQFTQRKVCQRIVAKGGATSSQ